MNEFDNVPEENVKVNEMYGRHKVTVFRESRDTLISSHLESSTSNRYFAALLKVTPSASGLLFLLV